MADILIQCTRCKKKYMESALVKVPKKTAGIVMSDMVCPHCKCRTHYDLTPQVAWCWASGLIEVGDFVPVDGPDGGGAILIAQGPKAFLKGKLAVLARHGQGESRGKLLVPGVPEAENDDEAIGALEDWIKVCKKRKDRNGVTFGSLDGVAL